MNRVLQTPRLRLRAPQPGDEQPAFELWARDRQVLRYLDWTPHTTVAETRAQLNWDQARWLKRSAWTWLMVQAHNGPIGMVQLVPQRFDAPPHHMRLGFLLARAHWGRGLMREAISAVVDEAFAQTQVRRIDALCDVENEASARLLQGLGFTLEGVLRQHSIHPNIGRGPRDVAVHARLRLDRS